MMIEIMLSGALCTAIVAFPNSLGSEKEKCGKFIQF